jgi:hypothetical protein
MAFVFGGVQKHFDLTHLSRHSTSLSWILQNLITCLSMQALAKSISCDQSVLLRYTWVFSLVMRMYRPRYIYRVWRESPSSCTSFLIYYSWMSLVWTTVGHSTPHGLKKSQSSPVVWGRHSGRRRRTLSLARWKRMCGGIVLSSVKHQWYAGWVGHVAYCRLRMWKFSHWANE